MFENWDDLRIFLALAREGKLTAVAKRLNVSHPTVARRVKQLEAAGRSIVNLSMSCCSILIFPTVKVLSWQRLSLKSTLL